MADGGSPLIPGLPYDLALNCLVRVSVASHKDMIHVSKPWRELLLDRDSEFYRQRTQLGILQPIVFLVPTIPAVRDEDMVTLFFRKDAILCPHKSQILVMGGMTGDGYDDRIVRCTKDFYIVDTLTRKIRRGPDMLLPTSAFARSPFGVLNDCLYVVGGVKDGALLSDSAEVQCYDISSNAWRRSCPMPFPVVPHLYFVQYGMFIVTGSSDEGGYCYLGYSNQSDSWTVCDADHFADPFAAKLRALQDQELAEVAVENAENEAEEEDADVTLAASTFFFGMVILQVAYNKYDNLGFKWTNMGDVGRFLQSQDMREFLTDQIVLLPRDALPSITIRDNDDEELNFSGQFQIIGLSSIKTPSYKKWYDLPLLFYPVCGEFSIGGSEFMGFNFVVVCY